MIGICGDNCMYCHRYIATKNGSREALENVKKLWVRLGLRDSDFPVQNMACNGCLPEKKCAYFELRACVNSRAHENCGLCDDYPCEIINVVFDKSEKLKARANEVCTVEEMEMLNKAFFSKKEYFDCIDKGEHESVCNVKHAQCDCSCSR